MAQPNIEIGVKAHFIVTLNLAIVDALIRESERHYDATCRSLSAPDGILTTWKRLLTGNNGLVAPSETWDLSVSFRDLDTLAKTCEMARDSVEAMQFMWAAMRAMQYWNENCTKWPLGQVRIGSHGNPPAEAKAGECGRCGSLPGSRDETCPDCTNPDGTAKI